MKKVLFIINPFAGTDRIKALTKAIDQHLDVKKYQYEITYTKYAKHATKLVEDAAENSFDIIIIVGGDGSINEVIQSIYKTNPILGIIPKGSGNGLAKSLKIPFKNAKAIQLINDLNIQEIEVGKVNEKLFISSVGVGFDAVVTAAFQNHKRRGFFTYIYIILKYIWTYKAKKWNFTIDEKSHQSQSFMLNIANGKYLGYSFQIAPKAKLNDGFFEVVNLKKHPILYTPIIAIKAFTGKIDKSRFVTIQKAKEISIYHPDLNKIQLDGESVSCANEIHIKMMPKKIKIISG